MSKVVLYQIFFRLFASKGKQIKHGSIEENGCTKFSDISKNVLSELKGMGYSHVWYTGILEHATATDYTKFGIKNSSPEVVKGRAGSPYAIRDYYDVCPDFAEDVSNRMGEFESLVERTHNAGLKMIIDFVPNHVAREYASDIELNSDIGAAENTSIHFHKDNNFYYFPQDEFVVPQGINYPYLKNITYKEFPAKATGNDAFTPHPSVTDWYETVKLNYGIDYLSGKNTYFDPVPSTWQKMLNILLYWSEKGVDGFRCDMAEMVPVEFWEWCIAKVKESFPKIIFIAEVYNPDEYRNYIFRGGFDYLYDKVGLYDTLRLNMIDQGSTEWITHRWQELDGINDKMLRFLENHDEQRIASDFFAGSAWRGVPALALSATMHNGPLMVYFGQEIGERGHDEEGFSGLDGRTTIFDYWSLPEYQKFYNGGSFSGKALSMDQKALLTAYKKILKITSEYEVFGSGNFYDLMWVNRSGLINHHKIYAYLRFNESSKFLIIANFNYLFDEYGKLKIPSDAFALMGLNDDKVIECIDVMNDNQCITLAKPQVCSNEGFDVNIPKGGVLFLKFQV